MKEFGGYIEFEHYRSREYHENCIALNCGRSALAYLIYVKNIRDIALPYFLCDSVADICRKTGVRVQYYHITDEFMPAEEVSEDVFFYFVNYYGLPGHAAAVKLADRYPGRIIFDNAQAFFERPVKGTDTLYTCRKFFGVADGAYLYTDSQDRTDLLPADESFERMGFLLGRYERPALEFYAEYVKNEESFSRQEVKKMSQLTKNLLRGIDYDMVKCRRNRNYRFLQERLKGINRLRAGMPDGPYMYPLYLEDGDRIRKKLLQEKIYIPTLWPDVLRGGGMPEKLAGI